MNNYTLSYIHYDKKGKLRADQGIAFYIDKYQKYRFVVATPDEGTHYQLITD